MTTLCFSGWGQPHDSLKYVTGEAHHIDYSSCSNYTDLPKSLNNTQADYVIGWSLGGQIALRLLANNIITTKKLILIGTPFRFVANDTHSLGTHFKEFKAFARSYKRNPEQLLQSFWQQIIRNDDRLTPPTAPDYKQHVSSHWSYWLDELGSFSCDQLNLSSIDTDITIIHGRNDAVVDCQQASLFIPFFPQANMQLFNQCGHAPHLHNPSKVRELIAS